MTNSFAGAFLCALIILQLSPMLVVAADTPLTDEIAESSTSTVATSSLATNTTAALLNQRQAQPANRDITQPEPLDEKVAILELFDSRQVERPTAFNFMAYWVQQAVIMGIPANTVFLILLTPILALLVSFVRVVVGLPTLDMLVPIALAFAFVAVGVAVGAFILAAILFGSYISKKVLSNVRIMFYPKRSLSMLFLAILVFAALTVAIGFDFERILDISIFPILILILLGDSIVSVQLYKSSEETFVITGTTIILGLLGYAMATSAAIQNTLIVYPELVLLTLPANLLIGRYFGLRVLELFRFNGMSS